MIAHSATRSVTDSRCLLLLDDDPDLRSLVVAVCDKHQWRFMVAEDRCDTLLPVRGQRPKFLVLGFSLDDENSLEFLWDLHAVYPQAPVGLITGDAADDIADVVGLAGGTAVVVRPCAAAEVSALM